MDFLLGGMAACCAGVVSNPFDLIRIRQQLQGELEKYSKAKSGQPYHGFFRSVRSIVQAEGILGLQKGLGPYLAFQFSINSVRLGLYQTVDSLNWTRNDNGEVSTTRCLFWGAFTGVIGASVGCPFFLVKTQIQSKSHGKFAVGFQHNHKGAIDALLTIRRTGIKNLWRGNVAFLTRTGVGSAAQLSTFTACKDYCQQYEIFRESTFLTAFASSLVSGFFASVCMTPFEVISTRLFNQSVDANGKGLFYNNIFDCFHKTFKAEGIYGLYKGFLPLYLRLAPHTILNLTFWELFKNWYNLYQNGENKNFDIY